MTKVVKVFERGIQGAQGPAGPQGASSALSQSLVGFGSPSNLVTGSNKLTYSNNNLQLTGSLKVSGSIIASSFFGKGSLNSLYTYYSDESAMANGLTYGDFYSLTDGNGYSIPGGLVKKILPLTQSQNPQFIGSGVLTDLVGYLDDDDAKNTGGLSIGQYYYLDIGNTYFMPPGLVKKITL